MDVSEITLMVKASQRGDRDAFGRLADAFQRPAMTVAIRLLWNQEQAEEVVQDSFVKAWLQIRRLRQAEHFQGWLLRIVSNTGLNHLRRRQRRFKLYQDSRGTPDRTLGLAHDHDRELDQYLREALARLGRKEAQAVSLTGLEGLSHEQAAQVMGCSAGSLRQHLFRARRKLKVMLKDYLE